ncbi:MAG TPA: aminodeoxychorismate/anthranilate synthase component II [Candidatus Bathyarchaeia archaeon]|nr:aminodeoxychorismate/anthranilate synthase component II [Candidatus Bathyarchaeia archaeon]
MSAHVLLVDNYDSFTWNLAQALMVLGARVDVVLNDAISPKEAVDLAPTHLVVSPGPGRPENAGASIPVLEALMHRVPTLGVCLGHQALGVIWGARIVQAPRLVHGKASPVYHDGRTIYAGLPSPFVAGRYHSLCVEDRTLPAEVAVCAYTSDGDVMGVRHATLPVEGVQFHPESILTPDGPRLLANFLATTPS